MDHQDKPGPLWPVLRPILLGIVVALLALGLMALASHLGGQSASPQ
jgi:RsiW-degrading membrane proteinase PrsW (M82 family)